MNDLWSLFFTMQLICYLRIYDTPIPSNAEIYMKEFIKIIEFQMLNPEALIGLFVPGFKMKEFIVGVQNNIVSQDQEASVIGDLMMYILFGGVGLIFLCIVLTLTLIERFRTKLLKKLMDFKAKFIWNGVIRSLTISWFGMLMTSGI